MCEGGGGAKNGKQILLEANFPKKFWVWGGSFPYWEEKNTGQQKCFREERFGEQKVWEEKFGEQNLGSKMY